MRRIVAILLIAVAPAVALIGVSGAYQSGQVSSQSLQAASGPTGGKFHFSTDDQGSIRADKAAEAVAAKAEADRIAAEAQAAEQERLDDQARRDRHAIALAAKNQASRQAKATSAPRPAKASASVAGGFRWVSSTAYSWGCGTPNQTTANGERPSVGGVAAAGLPFGSHWKALDGPMAGRTFRVNDRGAAFDIFMSSCSAATAYGRHQIRIAPA